MASFPQPVSGCSRLGLEKLPGAAGLGKQCFQASNCLAGVNYGAGKRRGASCAQHRPFLSLLWARSSFLMHRTGRRLPYGFSTDHPGKKSMEADGKLSPPEPARLPILMSGWGPTDPRVLVCS